MISFWLFAVSGGLWLWSSYLWFVCSRLKSPYRYVGNIGTRISTGVESNASYFNGITFDPIAVTKYFSDQAWLNAWAAGVSAAAAMATFAGLLAPKFGW